MTAKVIDLKSRLPGKNRSFYVMKEGSIRRANQRDIVTHSNARKGMLEYFQILYEENPLQARDAIENSDYSITDRIWFWNELDRAARV